jgi:hypothetical protein
MGHCQSNVNPLALSTLLNNVNIKLSLRLIKHYAMKTYGGASIGITPPYVLDLCTRWRWVVSFTIRPLNSGERAPGTHWLGGWINSSACLDDVENRKSYPFGNRTRAVQPVARRYTDCAIQTPLLNNVKFMLIIIRKKYSHPYSQKTNVISSKAIIG